MSVRSILSFFTGPFRKGVPALLLLLALQSAQADDCNQNGVEDSQDIAEGFSLDCNADGIPDECQDAVEQLLGTVPYLSIAMPVDFEPDGDLDLLASTLQGLYRYENVHPDSQFVSHLLSFDNSPARSLHSADLNGDGLPDLVADLGQTLRIFYAQGQGAYQQESFPFELPTLDGIASADLDNDGLLDLLLVCDSDPRVVWARQTAMGFEQQVIDEAVGGVTHVDCADLDEDGDLDVVLAHFEDDQLRVLFNDGAQAPSFDPHLVSQTAGGPLHLVLEDMDGDGLTDIVVTAYSDDQVHWYRHQGSQPATFQRQTIGNDAPGALSIEAEDMDSDGDPDLVVTHKLEHAVYWYENDGLPQPSFQAGMLKENVLFVLEAWPGDVFNNGLQDVLVPSRAMHSVTGVSQFIQDCNGNGTPDWCDISQGGSLDCNLNGRPDECESDCNGNGLPDHCDILDGTSLDLNLNGLADECENPKRPALAIEMQGSSIHLSWIGDAITRQYFVYGTLADDSTFLVGTTEQTEFQLPMPYVTNRLVMRYQVVASSEAP